MNKKSQTQQAKKDFLSLEPGNFCCTNAPGILSNLSNKKRKGQEEIVGFVAVVLLVAVVFTIVLGIMLFNQKNSNVSESNDILQFLESALQATSSCALQFEPAYSSFGELIIACAQQSAQTCKPSEKTVCEELNRTLSSVIKESWHVGNNYSFQGYNFRALEISKANQTREIISLTEGTCNEGYTSHEYLLPERRSRNTITVILKLCN